MSATTSPDPTNAPRPAEPGDAAYLEVNRANWDERATAHARSPGYDLARFRTDPRAISDVVAFDVPRLPDLTGRRGIHLQCHIGTDTLSLARLGATMTGLDLSPASIAVARALAEDVGADLGADLDYVEADVFSAPEVLAEQAPFDFVFTGIGALCWLPSIDRWAATVAALLGPGGQLFLREGHPVLWAVDDETARDGLVLRFPYFEHEEALIWDEPGTYVETDAEFTHNTTHTWNRGLGEIVTALLAHGLAITRLDEHDSVPWEALPGIMEPHPDHPGELRLREGRDRLPLSYTLHAVKA